MCDFSTILKDYRKKNNISQAEFAKKIGVNRSLISRIEGNTVPASNKLIYQVINVFADFNYNTDTAYNYVEPKYINELPNVFLKTLREFFKLSQTQFADKLNIDHSTISKIETGNILVSDVILEKVYWRFSILELYKNMQFTDEINFIYRDYIKNPLHFLTYPNLQYNQRGKEDEKIINCKAEDLLSEIYLILSEKEKFILSYFIEFYKKYKYNTITFSSIDPPIELIKNESFEQFYEQLCVLKQYYFNAKTEGENGMKTSQIFTLLSKISITNYDDGETIISVSFGSIINDL